MTTLWSHYKQKIILKDSKLRFNTIFAALWRIAIRTLIPIVIGSAIPHIAGQAATGDDSSSKAGFIKNINADLKMLARE